jgi:hypothetical protein
MNAVINEKISHLIKPINVLVPMQQNPRHGDVEAIMASFQQFGQVMPIVVKPNGDGTYTVLSGNHRVEAAKRLGWSHLAVVEYDADDKTAVAFALADNRSSELGTVDADVLYDVLVDVLDEHHELFEKLGWDDFELASMDTASSSEPISSAYIAPVISEVPSRPSVDVPQQTHVTSNDENDVAVRGATSTQSSGQKGVVQYTLIFDDPDQQKRWYDFLRWLRLDPGTDGETTVRRLINFVEAHANF